MARRCRPPKCGDRVRGEPVALRVGTAPGDSARANRTVDGQTRLHLRLRLRGRAEQPHGNAVARKFGDRAGDSKRSVHAAVARLG